MHLDYIFSDTLNSDDLLIQRQALSVVLPSENILAKTCCIFLSIVAAHIYESTE